jgi:hypothetical protein
MPDAYDDYYEGPCCSLCDGLGHGYPGGGPCPLEISYAVRDETDTDDYLGLT